MAAAPLQAQQIEDTVSAGACLAVDAFATTQEAANFGHIRRIGAALDRVAWELSNVAHARRLFHVLLEPEIPILTPRSPPAVLHQPVLDSILLSGQGTSASVWRSTPNPYSGSDRLIMRETTRKAVRSDGTVFELQISCQV